MVLRRGENPTAHKGLSVSKQQARDERKVFRTEARLRMKVEMAGNGAMFRRVGRETGTASLCAHLLCLSLRRGYREA